MVYFRAKLGDDEIPMFPPGRDWSHSAPFGFTTSAVVVDGEFVLRVHELNLFASGATLHSAMTELDDLLVEYADMQLGRPVDETNHVAHLLRAYVEAAQRSAVAAPVPPRSAAIQDRIDNLDVLTALQAAG